MSLQSLSNYKRLPPIHHRFNILPSGKKFRSIGCKTDRLKNSCYLGCQNSLYKLRVWVDFSYTVILSLLLTILLPFPVQHFGRCGNTIPILTGHSPPPPYLFIIFYYDALVFFLFLYIIFRLFFLYYFLYYFLYIIFFTFTLLWSCYLISLQATVQWQSCSELSKKNKILKFLVFRYYFDSNILKSDSMIRIITQKLSNF